MNKIKQNKYTFSLIIIAIIIIFSSIVILSLPVLFNYNSKATKIEKNFYNSFKIYLNSSSNISYKPFPKPHLLIENASLSLNKSGVKKDLINTKNLRIFISLKDIYLRSFKNIISTEILNSNIELNISDFKELRKHLYQKINKPIIFKNCKIFLRNKKNEVILISPIKKVSYKINTKTKIKNFLTEGEIFGLKFKSEWKRDYATPKTTIHDINIYNPNIDVKSTLEFEDIEKFNGQTQILFLNDKLVYNYQINNGKIDIYSPKDDTTNFDINTRIQISPFYFNGNLLIKNKKVENIIDNFLLYLIDYNKNYLGNLNGKIKIEFKDLNNKLIKNGILDLIIREKKIYIKNSEFNLDKIGTIKTKMSFEEDKGGIKFFSNNILEIKNYIEFAKAFQVGSNKIKNIKEIYFDIEKFTGETDFIIKNVKFKNKNDRIVADEIFLVENIQNLRSHIRKLVD